MRFLTYDRQLAEIKIKHLFSGAGPLFLNHRLHITRPTLYHYSKSKDEILFECVRLGLEMIGDTIGIAEEASGNTKERFIACIKEYTQIVTTDVCRCVIRVGEDTLPRYTRFRLRALKCTINHKFRRLIAEEIADGSFIESDPKMSSYFVAGALSWFGRWYRNDGTLTPDQLADHCIAFLDKGMLKKQPATKMAN